MKKLNKDAQELREVDELLERYKNLARKLGKLPSYNEVVKFIGSYNKIARRVGSTSVLKDMALTKFPELEGLAVPVRLAIDDVDAYRLSVEKSKNRKSNAALVKSASALEYIAQFADNVFSGSIKPTRPMSSKSKLNRALNLTLSDLHFGSDTKTSETGFQSYGRLEESRRLATIIQQTIDYKPQYRKDTILCVNLLGDLIQHKLHDPQDAAPMAEQVCRAIHLLSQALAQLAENFPRVEVHCATGNHGRDMNRHVKRATSGKWDSVETVIYYALVKILSKYKNVKFHIPKTPFAVYEVFGHKIFATHGDTVLKPGNPGKSLNISGLENQLNKINATLKDSDEIKVAIVGHTHVASVSILTNGTFMVTNGALPPIDQFCVSIGILEGVSSQTLFEMTKDHAVGDIRFILVGLDNDRNAALDKIVQPWDNLEE